MRHAIEAQRLCVLYDPESGAIVHGHFVTTLAGGVALSDEEMEQRTLERASMGGRDAGRLLALHVDAEAYEAGTHYRIDTVRRRLIEVEARRR